MTQSQDQEVSLVIVDDHAIWRGGLRSLFAETEFLIVGEASSGSEAMVVVRKLAEEHRTPSLVLMDIRMAGGDGLDALTAFKAEFPSVAVVMLTTYDNPTYMARAVSGGAAGYLLKGIDFEEILVSLRAVAGGESLLSAQELKRSLRGLNAESPGAQDLIHPLTDREVEVLQLLSTGLSNRDIAPLLYISESTVKTHIEHIIGKLGVSDRVQAAVWAARHGLTS